MPEERERKLDTLATAAMESGGWDVRGVCKKIYVQSYFLFYIK